MRKPRNISAVFFAFLFAGVIGVGTAQADTPIGPYKNCGTAEEPKYSYNEKCDGFDKDAADTQSTSSTSQSSQTPTYSSQSSYQPQPAPQTQTHQQAAPAPKQEEKPAVTEPKKTATDDPKEVAATTDVAGAISEETPQPFLPLWAALGIAGIAGIYAFTMRRFGAFGQKS